MGNQLEVVLPVFPAPQLLDISFPVAGTSAHLPSFLEGGATLSPVNAYCSEILYRVLINHGIGIKIT